jgi:hypothetical protein
VRTNGSTGSFTVLSPRQALTPVLYALYAARAASVAATNITGALADAQLPDSVARLSAGGKPARCSSLHECRPAQRQPDFRRHRHRYAVCRADGRHES